METTMVRALIEQIRDIVEELQYVIDNGGNCVQWRHHGRLFFPAEGVEITLNPVERTLYHLFLSHPEGITADNLLLHWDELCQIYGKESCYDEKPRQLETMESLCSESKKVFYSTVSRIKQKVVKALGAWRAEAYFIKKGKDGVYKLKATLLPVDV